MLPVRLWAGLFHDYLANQSKLRVSWRGICDDSGWCVRNFAGGADARNKFLAPNVIDVNGCRFPEIGHLQPSLIPY